MVASLRVSPLHPARLLWTDDGPRSLDFDDVYFSRAGGLTESRHVFLHHNQLEARFRALGDGSFTVAETGFGTGLNFLACAQLWREYRNGNGWLHFVSAEKHPLTLPDLRRALALWPELATLAEPLLSQYPPLLPGFHRLCFAETGMTLTLLFGDACEQLSRLQARVDAWFLDGFAPARNDSLWQPDLFAELARLSRPGTSFATFTAASAVRRALQAAGFAVRKVTGHGQKREMLVGEFAGQPPAQKQPWLVRPLFSRRPQTAAVIGAGIAGASVADVLAQRGIAVTVFDSAGGPAQGASGNPAAMVYPRLAAPTAADTNFQQQAFLHARQRYTALGQELWQPCGLLWLLQGTQTRAGKNLEGHPWAGLEAELLEPRAASAGAGITLASSALHFPQAGWVKAQALCQTLLQQAGINTRYNTSIKNLEYDQATQQWCLQADDSLCFSSDIVVLANAGAALHLVQTAQLLLQPVRGQIAEVAASADSEKLRKVICHGGYISPAINGWHCLGASFHPGRDDTEVEAADNELIRTELAESLPVLAAELPPAESWRGRASLRWQTPDYLPLVGALPIYADFLLDFAGLRDGNNRCLPEMPKYWPGLYASLGHGSLGFTQATLAAELLAAEILDEPCPAPAGVSDSLHPARFWVKALRRREI